MASVVPQQIADIDGDHIEWLTPADDVAFFDQQVRAIMGMSGEEFLRKLDSGELDRVLEADDDRDLAYLVLLADLGR